ncbi:MAG: hypothetical protein JWM78_1852 [Verrucomicrobiaceae bacterium]|nr:hypothetical protein [Verrucomicrobiaceae bacterium]
MLKGILRWILLSVGTAFLAQVNAADINTQGGLKDTQKLNQSDHTMTMAWWIPDELWAISAANDPSRKEGVKK